MPEQRSDEALWAPLTSTVLAEGVHAAPTAETVAEVERVLGFRLPRAYVDLVSTTQNGGYLADDRRAHPSPSRTSWADDHVQIDTILAVAVGDFDTLGGATHHCQKEWGYPRIGVYFGWCPSAGHDMIALDYRACGPEGEPSVVHVDQEWDYAVTPLAPSFREFVDGLVSPDLFPLD